MSTADDLLARALQAFARNGYVRSSVQGIAWEARVSTRTIYNLYGGKAGLCEAVLGFSTRRMAGHHIRPIHACLSEPDIYECLVQFATNWVGRGPWSESHQALVRHVQAKRPQLPQSAIDAWVTLGPLGVRVLLENELRRFFARSQSQSPPTDLAVLTGHVDRPAMRWPATSSCGRIRKTLTLRAGYVSVIVGFVGVDPPAGPVVGVAGWWRRRCIVRTARHS